MNVRFLLLLGSTIWLLQGCVHHNQMAQSFVGCEGTYKLSPYSLESLDKQHQCAMYNGSQQ